MFTFLQSNSNEICHEVWILCRILSSHCFILCTCSQTVFFLVFHAKNESCVLLLALFLAITFLACSFHWSLDFRSSLSNKRRMGSFEMVKCWLKCRKTLFDVVISGYYDLKCCHLLLWFDVGIWCYDLMLWSDVMIWCYYLMLRLKIIIWCYDWKL